MTRSSACFVTGFFLLALACVAVASRGESADTTARAQAAGGAPVYVDYYMRDLVRQEVWRDFR